MNTQSVSLTTCHRRNPNSGYVPDTLILDSSNDITMSTTSTTQPAIRVMLPMRGSSH